MRGTASEQASFTSIDFLVEELLDDEGFLATLGECRGALFCDEDFDALYPSNRGRPSHPPSLLAALLLAQIFYGVSDREAERRSRLDLSWKHALGLSLEHKGIPHICLVDFRARVIRAEMAGFFNDKLLALAKRAGVIGHRRVIDSTGIADAVATMDTISLIRSASRHCLKTLEGLDPNKAKELTASLCRDDYDKEGKPEINWSLEADRRQLVNELFNDASAIIASCSPLTDDDLQAAVALLSVVSAQDLAKGEDGQVEIARGVAKDRVISTVDPETRHGHRSRSDRYDGYKAHLSTDVDSDLVVAARASSARTPDSEVLGELIDDDPVAVKEVIADTHYGSAKSRIDLGQAGIELVAPAPPIPRRPEYFSKEDFSIDFEHNAVTCPAGITIKASEARRKQARFGHHCTGCALAARCTEGTGGRTIEINPAEELLSTARHARWTAEFRDRYRERARSERKNAQLKFRSQKIPWRGLVKADAWVKMRVAAMNLDRMGRIPGLIG